MILVSKSYAFVEFAEIEHAEECYREVGERSPEKSSDLFLNESILSISFSK